MQFKTRNEIFFNCDPLRANSLLFFFCVSKIHLSPPPPPPQAVQNFVDRTELWARPFDSLEQSLHSFRVSSVLIYFMLSLQLFPSGCVKKSSNFLMYCKYLVDATETTCARSVTPVEHSNCTYSVLDEHMNCVWNAQYSQCISDVRNRTAAGALRDVVRTICHFQNAVRFHGAGGHVILFTTITKVRPSIHRFSRKVKF